MNRRNFFGTMVAKATALLGLAKAPQLATTPVESLAPYAGPIDFDEWTYEPRWQSYTSTYATMTKQELLNKMRRAYKVAWEGQEVEWQVATGNLDALAKDSLDSASL